MDKPSRDKLKWRLIQNHLKYSKDELELFKGNPRNEAVLDKGRDLQNKRIIIEVVEAHGCNSQHQVGDKFIFDGAGNLLTKHNPEKICVFALNAASELFYAGVDPNQMKFRRSGSVLRCWRSVRRVGAGCRRAVDGGKGLTVH